MEEFVVMILNCKKYNHKRMKQKKWLSKFTNLIYFHVIGEPTMEEPYRFDDTEKILYVKTKDDYMSLSHKVISGMSAFAQRYPFKYLLKLDDDQNLVKMSFFRLLTTALMANWDNPANRKHYGGDMVYVKEPTLSTLFNVHPEMPRNYMLLPGNYAGGCCYVVSRESVEHLLRQKEELVKHIFEDYGVGQILKISDKNKIIEFNYKDYFVE
jgi:hypothetical protein